MLPAAVHVCCLRSAILAPLCMATYMVGPGAQCRCSSHPTPVCLDHVRLHLCLHTVCMCICIRGHPSHRRHTHSKPFIL
jgi:hypothetical protein